MAGPPGGVCPGWPSVVAESLFADPNSTMRLIASTQTALYTTNDGGSTFHRRVRFFRIGPAEWGACRRRFFRWDERVGGHECGPAGFRQWRRLLHALLSAGHSLHGGDRLLRGSQGPSSGAIRFYASPPPQVSSPSTRGASTTTHAARMFTRSMWEPRPGWRIRQVSPRTTSPASWPWPGTISIRLTSPASASAGRIPITIPSISSRPSAALWASIFTIPKNAKYRDGLGRRPRGQ